MPYKVVKDEKKCSASKPYAVINSQTGDAKGCHPTREHAIKQLRALYRNVPEARKMSEHAQALSFLIPLKFSEGAKWQDGNKLWLQIYPFDTWDHPMFGETTIDQDRASALKHHFDANARGHEVVVDYEHGLDPAKGKKAAGWYRQLEVKDNGLWGLVEFTDTAKHEIEKGEWKYFSGEHYDTWTHPQNKETYDFVLTGGALTNKPWVKDMIPLNFSEVVVEKNFADLPNTGEEVPVPDVKDEHADVEHSEPGTGGNVDPSINRDDSADEGWRRDSPPAAEDGSIPDRSKTVTNDEKKDAVVGDDEDDDDDEDGDEMNETELRQLLGIDTGADLVGAVRGAKEKADKYDAVKTDVEEKKAFSEMFPEQASELERLRTERLSGMARQFSEEVGKLRFKDKPGEDAKTTTMGLSGLALQTIEETAKKFTEGNATLEDYKESLEAIFNNGVVDYGTTGSSRTNQKDDYDTPRNYVEARKQFSELVLQIQKADSLDFDAALRVAAEREPDLFEAYRQPPVIAG